jgi:ribosome recycling factor
MKDTYKEVRVFQYDNAVVRVHIPDLTSEEKSRRMKEVERSAMQLILASKK